MVHNKGALQLSVVFVSGMLGLIVVVLLFLNWPDLKAQKKQFLKKEFKPTPVKPQKMIEAVPGAVFEEVALPPPPLRDVTKQVGARKSPPKPKFLPIKPAAKTTRAAADIVRTVSQKRQAIEKGRTLLRLLEHGSGPSIEFAWPESPGEKDQLYRVFVQCHGMRIALLDERDRLFASDSPAGQKWQINLDRYSAFMRQISGRSVDLERQKIIQIKRRHSGMASATPVRIFTRQMDAYVLGSLGQVLGSGYREKGVIQARYKLRGNTILVTEIVADGVLKNGEIYVPCARKQGV